MRRFVKLLPLAAAAALLYPGAGTMRASAQTQAKSSASAASPSPEQRFVTTYCVTCHNARLKTADLLLDSVNPLDPAGNAAVWEKVLQKVRTGVMPPPAARHPEPAAAASFVSAIALSLDKAAAAHPNPGRLPLVHRLNRSEYRNAI